ncbi:TrmH family RNA methyltransferase [Alienimonas chondri]|uniref:TrmH family tRNA/rRNA methyltransferase n=1 Tax=Alienimonas chondri TaxID=2681879 RepID=A0ABX1VBX6_9PLAN|nr:RNA methyltransferase [Alienimonas chondri]NNJ25189.1 putative TrmH family tRNA/rRNA methyltransferase [Alienimonas chondri]
MPKSPLLGNHQKCWVRGRHAVAGVLRVRWDPYEVRIAETADPGAADEITLTCEHRGIPVIASHAANLTKLCGGADHQGFAAKMPPFPYANAAGLLRTPPTLTVVLDGVQDPHNLGAILRSAAEFDADAVLLPASGAAGVSAGAVHSGAGAVGATPIARVPDLAETLKELKAKGVRIAAATLSGDAVGPWEADLAATPERPLALVVGAEWRGVSPQIAALADVRLRLPTGPVGSLNAAVAAGVLLYEVSRVKTR